METEAKNKTAEVLFEEIYGKLHGERVTNIVKLCRLEALIEVVAQCKPVLNRRLVQINDKKGPYKLMYEFDAEIDSGTLGYYYHEEYASHRMILTLKETLKDDVPPVVEPAVFADAMFGPIFEDLTKRLEVSEKTGEQGKIYIPEGFYYFTWGQQWASGGQEGPEKPHSAVIQAKNWDDARQELWKHVSHGNECAFDFKAFHHNKWHDLQLVNEKNEKQDTLFHWQSNI